MCGCCLAWKISSCIKEAGSNAWLIGKSLTVQVITSCILLLCTSSSRRLHRLDIKISLASYLKNGCSNASSSCLASFYMDTCLEQYLQCCRISAKIKTRSNRKQSIFGSLNSTNPEGPYCCRKKFLSRYVGFTATSLLTQSMKLLKTTTMRNWNRACKRRFKTQSSKVSWAHSSCCSKALNSSFKEKLSLTVNLGCTRMTMSLMKTFSALSKILSCQWLRRRSKTPDLCTLLSRAKCISWIS